MKRSDLLRLKEIAEMKREADLQVISRISAQMGAIQASIDTIRNQVTTRTASTDLDTSRLSGADVRWQQFAEEQLRTLQQRRAGLAAAREGYLAQARKSFGRAEAVKGLLGTAKKPRR